MHLTKNMIVDFKISPLQRPSRGKKVPLGDTPVRRLAAARSLVGHPYKNGFSSNSQTISGGDERGQYNHGKASNLIGRPLVKSAGLLGVAFANIGADMDPVPFDNPVPVHSVTSRLLFGDSSSIGCQAALITALTLPSAVLSLSTPSA
jgi:hypothetical protein